MKTITRIDWHPEAAMEKIEFKLKSGIEAGTLGLENEIKRRCPVGKDRKGHKAGELRDSIQHIIYDGGRSSSVYTTNRYARFIEFGTRYMYPRAFFRPALDWFLLKFGKYFSGEVF